MRKRTFSLDKRHKIILQYFKISLCLFSKGRGYGTKMLNFVERFAPIQKIGVVSCQDNLINMYERKGYEIVEKEPMNDKNVPNISRDDLEFVIMLKNKSHK